MELGLPLKMAGKNREPKERQYFAELVEPHVGHGGIEYLGEVSHGEKVELLQDARDALPDRVGGAVRPGDDRVDGVRHAGDRDPPRRRARGDRARGERDHRRQLPQMAGALEQADASIRTCRRYVEERFAPERMVGDYERPYAAALSQ